MGASAEEIGGFVKATATPNSQQTPASHNAPVCYRQAYERPSTAAPQRQAPAACQRQAGHQTILAGPGPAPRSLHRGRQPAPGPANSAESDTGNITVDVVPGQSLRLVVQVVGARDADACRQRLDAGERHDRVQVIVPESSSGQALGQVPGRACSRCSPPRIDLETNHP